MNRSDVITVPLADDGTFPNNEKLPALVYRQAFETGEDEPEGRIEEGADGPLLLHWRGD